MTEKTFEEAASFQIKRADEWMDVLVNASTGLYAEWESDAAFYTLRAAVDVALTPEQFTRVRMVAVRRRDEHLTSESGVTAANHGNVTTDGPLTDALIKNHYVDSYAALVDDIDRQVGWRRQPSDSEGASEFWVQY